MTIAEGEEAFVVTAREMTLAAFAAAAWPTAPARVATCLARPVTSAWFFLDVAAI